MPIWAADWYAPFEVGRVWATASLAVAVEVSTGGWTALVTEEVMMWLLCGS
jgi:hypothetical protein